MGARLAVLVLTALLWACGEDTSIGIGADQADALAAADLAVMGEDADAAASTSAAELPAWLTGTWLECNGTLSITAPAQATWKPAGDACAFTATVAFKDGGLDFTSVDPGSCHSQAPIWFTAGTHAAFDGQQLTVIFAKLFYGVKRFSHKGVRENWQFTGSNGGGGTMRLCFDDTGLFYDGNWNSSGCNMIACGSLVTQVKNVQGVTQIWTTCQGDCPCTAILMAKDKSAAAMAGSYSGGSCKGGENGTFTATSKPFPD